ncbi:malonyl-ACP O-methyltransferase BioC [Neiella marina]|uniref:Malonyl-[acyl-carrier protein] O-methyltransferase n=1 Tax=Neiella holothuriorum TaxID=2870530 RepID=A0ABS7EDF6_9GAMM|nr:malonyl-ACP O-methyltransferase BioC [Neiella holothuriorum]MBW8190259.1 malonyl-ACP O-methyltransferase BioC [Neiella holothuriorum]
MTVVEVQPSVAKRFSKASKRYHEAATVQQQVGRNLLAYNPVRNAKVAVDLGCGPGSFVPALMPLTEHLFAVDLSPAMLRQCRLVDDQVVAVQGDAQQLPFADNSVDLIFSSLALQWVSDLDSMFEEAQRVLKPGGSLVFSCVTEGSLWQLKKAWLKVDDYDHVNRFASVANIDKAANHARLQKAIGVVRPHTFWYPDIRALFGSIRDVGANTVIGSKRQGLIGRQLWQKFQQAYDRFRTEEGLPLTYQIYYGVVTK